MNCPAYSTADSHAGDVADKSKPSMSWLNSFYEGFEDLLVLDTVPMRFRMPADGEQP